MSGPLEGFKVVDLTSMISGPLATMILGDQGADIIKIEAPAGDHTRHVATRRSQFSASFLNNNRNKRSVVLDLKTADGLSALEKLVMDADVFVQNFRPGVADRIGIGAEKLCSLNPGLVYLSIAGFGFEGPYAAKPVFDPLIQSLSGLTTVQAGSDDEKPRLVRTILPDKLTGFAAAQAICAALLARSKTGQGQHVRISMLDTVLAFLWSSDMGGHTFVGSELTQETAQSFIDLIYQTADGYISVAVMRPREWAGLARATGNSAWIDDERFKTSAGLDRYKDARLQLTQQALLQETTETWLSRLEAEDVPCAPVLARRDVIRHAQVLANRIIVETEHPQAGQIRQTRTPADFTGTPTVLPAPAPQLGAHTQDILRQTGISEDAIASMLSSGAAVQAIDREGDL